MWNPNNIKGKIGPDEKKFLLGAFDLDTFYEEDAKFN